MRTEPSSVQSRTRTDTNRIKKSSAWVSRDTFRPKDSQVGVRGCACPSVLEAFHTSVTGEQPKPSHLLEQVGLEISCRPVKHERCCDCTHEGGRSRTPLLELVSGGPHQGPQTLPAPVAPAAPSSIPACPLHAPL